MPDAPLPRFADPRATKPVALGPCRCPGTPHADGDSAVVRAQIGDGEAKSATVVGFAATGGRYYDSAAGDNEAVARFTISWTLVDGDGRAVPITPELVTLLDEDTRDTLARAIAESVGNRGGPLPNGSGAPSRRSSPATSSASRIRGTRARR